MTSAMREVNLGFFLNDRRGAGHGLGGRGIIEGFLEEVMAEISPEGEERFIQIKNWRKLDPSGEGRVCEGPGGRDDML